MKNIAKKKFKQYIHKLFKAIKKHKIYLKVKKIPLFFRIVIFVFCILWFMISTLLFPPLPFGNLFLMIGLIIVFPIDKVKSVLYYVVHKTRVTWLYTKWLKWKNVIKRKFRTTSQ